MKTRVAVYDTKEHIATYVTNRDLDAAKVAEKGRYVPAEFGAKYAIKDATFEEIQSASEIARSALDGLKADSERNIATLIGEGLPSPPAVTVTVTDSKSS